MSFAVRRLGPGDVDAYRALRLLALRDAPDAFGSSYEEAAARPEGHLLDLLRRLAVFGAVAGDGALVGLVAFSRNEGARHRHRGDMVSMFVRPRMRGTGCAQKLVETLLDHARGEVLQVHCGVGTYNTPAIRLYERAGFTIYGTEPRSLNVDGRFIDEHLMVRFLDQEEDTA